ncbi:hypothetical protein EVAR_17199_1 [Eumeta japonica]|uniref:Uncharacterized protein n=1 Tax=Eumeta variegata TaxID=151549 RepID=A0A4C1U8Y2_EUMVA|nr:hypothetical protein EVAR_17199_1 [Eumeta japonica]
MSGRRRRSNIGRSSVNAKRVRSQRDEESSTEREARLSQLRDRYRAERERESSIEREVRRSRDRDRHSVQRDRESSVEREARLSQLRDRYRADRERESSVEREVRRSRDRDRHRIQRTRESSARVTNSWVNKENSAMNYDPSISYKDDRIVSIGTMSVVCEYCLALKFKDESKGMCCLQGKVKLEEILPPPEPLHSLLTGDHQKSKQFMRNIRRYNNAFQMTSLRASKSLSVGSCLHLKFKGKCTT